MAISFEPSGSLRGVTVPVSAMPLTLACWFNRNSSVDVVDRLFTLQNYDGSEAFSIDTQGAAGIQVRAVSTVAGVQSRANSAYNGAPNSWVHATAVFASATSRVAYVGKLPTLNSTSATPTGVSEINLGSTFASGVRSASFRGSLANFAVWSAQLTVADVASLAAGVSPLKVRPSSLVFFLPGIRELKDVKGFTLTASGTSVADHPPFRQ